MNTNNTFNYDIPIKYQNLLERYWKEFGCLQNLESLGIGQNDGAPQLKWNIVVPDWKKILLGMNCLYLGDPNHDKDKQ